jgi:hypothetical protein
MLGPLCAVVLAGQAEAQNGIQSLAYEGAGCPAGGVGVSISADRTTLTLIFDQYVAFTGPSIPAAEAAKDCVIVLELMTDDPAVATIDTRGYVQLSAGLSATSQSHVPRAKKSTLVTSFAGPIARDRVDRNIVTMLPIGGPNPKFLIVTSVEIDNTANPTAPGQITLDSLDLKLTAVSSTP